MSVSSQTIGNASPAEDFDEREESGVGGRRILLVDEQAHVLRVIRLNLERCGYLVDAVLSADLVLQHLHDHHYDAVILTSDLPDMTSAQLSGQIQVYFDTRDSDAARPLMLVGQDDAVECIAKADHCEPLTRPVSLKLIVARLGKHFESMDCPAVEYC